MPNEKDICVDIERLVQYGLKHCLIEDADAFITRNAYLDIYSLSKPCNSEQIEQIQSEEYPNTPENLLKPLLDYAGNINLFDNEIDALRVNFEARLMGILMPRQSEIARKFSALYKEKGARVACDYFYDLCIKANYIRSAQIAKNIQWGYDSKYGNLEITINLTKPEKDPKTIELERLQPSASYPKCMLCIENLGYAGRINFPARQTHRAMPIDICGEDYFLQYSPYVYYNEHCIVFSAKHEPMQINSQTFKQILSFVKQFSHYTFGSNADLPIVGGSILSHAHFQGGNYVFPMHKAKTTEIYTHEDYKSIKVYNINWPMSTLRVKSENENEICAFATHVLNTWREYEDCEAEILAYSEINGKKTPHNTITPIMHYNENEKQYILDLVPRNNRTSSEHPLGIFHPHAQIHHIKKENIGLIEVMGLAILPARLQSECEKIKNMLEGRASKNQLKDNMPHHADWIDYLCDKYGENLSTLTTQNIIKDEIGAKFQTCLEHAGVFKQDENGKKAYQKFMLALGCKKVT